MTISGSIDSTGAERVVRLPQETRRRRTCRDGKDEGHDSKGARKKTHCRKDKTKCLVNATSPMENSTQGRFVKWSHDREVPLALP